MATNAEIAAIFEDMAALLEMKGDSVFKVRAYQRAARTIAQLPFSVEERVREGKGLRDIPGIGAAIDKKTREYLSEGKVRAYEELKAELPGGVTALLKVPGIGPRTALLVARELGVSTIEELQQAAVEGRLSSLPGVGEKTAQRILRHARALTAAQETRIPLAEALPVAEEVIGVVRERCPGIHHLSPAGSLRRWRETVGDIDIMGTADDPPRVIDTLVGLPRVTEVLAYGPKKASVVVEPGVQVDLRIVEDDTYGALIQYFTGSQQHNLRLRDYANRMGLSLSEYGVTDLKTGELQKFAEEEAFYARLGLQYIPPELREGVWEVDLARRRALPTLVEVADIKGDLHVHTDWSDGHDSLEAMASAAASNGYQYLVVADHSVGLGIASGLTPERLHRQIGEIRALEGRYPIKVFCGCEVDIRADGTLDYPDELLAELDVVVAAVHSALGQDRERMTARIVKAMANPHVTILAHPTCRLLGERGAIDVDVEMLLRTARETGTALEVNAFPYRLDLKDSHALRARELRVPLAINTDAHRATQLDTMRFGVAMARRGWCEARHVLNTRPLEAFQAYIRAPKKERARLLAGETAGGH